MSRPPPVGPCPLTSPSPPRRRYTRPRPCLDLAAHGCRPTRAAKPDSTGRRHVDVPRETAGPVGNGASHDTTARLAGENPVRASTAVRVHGGPLLRRRRGSGHHVLEAATSLAHAQDAGARAPSRFASCSEARRDVGMHSHCVADGGVAAVSRCPVGGAQDVLRRARRVQGHGCRARAARSCPENFRALSAHTAGECCGMPDSREAWRTGLATGRPRRPRSARSGPHHSGDRRSSRPLVPGIQLDPGRSSRRVLASLPVVCQPRPRISLRPQRARHMFHVKRAARKPPPTLRHLGRAVSRETTAPLAQEGPFRWAGRGPGKNERGTAHIPCPNVIGPRCRAATPQPRHADAS